MAADITMTMEMRNDTVIKSMRQVGAESERLNRKAQQASGRAGGYRGGMGILEVSRAVEDAQYGLRGVLNNIPGIIQSFGGSMGLAGVVSIAAVAVSVLGKSFYDMAIAGDKSKETIEQLKERTKTYTAALQEISASRKKFAREQKQSQQNDIESEKLKDFIKGLGDPSKDFQEDNNDAERTRNIRDRIRLLEDEKEALMGFGGFTQPLNPTKDAASDLRKSQDLEYTLKRKQYLLDKRLNEERNKLPAKDDSAQKGFDSQKAIAKAESEIKRLEAIKKNAEEAASSTSEIVKEAFTALFRARGSEDPLAPIVFEESSREVAQQTANSATKQLEQAKENLDLLKAQSEQGKTSQGITVERIATLTQEVEKNRQALADATKKAEIAKEELNTKKKELDLQKEINELKIGNTGLLGIPMLGDMMSMMNEVRMMRDESALSQFSMNNLNPSNMLSSAGRVGMAANEFNSGISTANYQREALSQLKKIASNTKKGKVTAYS